MASYYYLVSSLPMLRPDGPSPLTTDRFLDACRSTLSARDFHLVRCALDGTPAANKFLRTYQHYVGMIRASLTEARARKLGLPLDRWRNEGEKSYVIDAVVQKAVNDENPLAGEMALIVLEWKYLDELSLGHTFDTDGLLAYALKLALITRKNLFTNEAGNAEFQRLFAKLESDIKSMELE